MIHDLGAQCVKVRSSDGEEYSLRKTKRGLLLAPVFGVRVWEGHGTRIGDWALGMAF